MICDTTTGSLADFDNELANANFLYPSNGTEGPLFTFAIITANYLVPVVLVVEPESPFIA